MRDVRYYTFNDTQAFEKACHQEFKTLCNNYNFYYSGKCIKISKDIFTLVKSKPDFYNHKVTLYYNKDGVYLVAYTKKFIVIEILTSDEVNITRYVHGLVKRFEEYITDESSKYSDVDISKFMESNS